MRNALDEIWYGHPSIWLKPLEASLAAATLGYRCGLEIDRRKKLRSAKRLPIPVLSVGNLTVGGTGKTPIVQFLAQAALDAGRKPAILSRGYGGEGGSSQKVDLDHGNWKQYGDEPSLLATDLPEVPVWVGRSRYESGLAALEENSQIDLILLDDGFQHRELHRDFDLVLVDSQRGLGNGRVLPWGPLREPTNALQRADRVAIVRKSEGDPTWQPPASFQGELMELDLEPIGWQPMGEPSLNPMASLPRDRAVHSLTGIGAPQSFDRLLQVVGLEVREKSHFGDHHSYTEEEISGVIKRCEQEGARLFTTAKDAIRLKDLPMVWTEAQRPIIIQIGLKSGDGTVSLKKILNSLGIAKPTSDQIEISGGGYRHGS